MKKGAFVIVIVNGKSQKRVEVESKGTTRRDTTTTHRSVCSIYFKYETNTDMSSCLLINLS